MNASFCLDIRGNAQVGKCMRLYTGIAMSEMHRYINVSRDELRKIHEIVLSHSSISEIISTLGKPDEVILVNSLGTSSQYRFSRWQTVSLVVLEGHNSEITCLALPVSDSGVGQAPAQ